MKRSQVTIRLHPQTKINFDAYAAKFGLDASELARLLIIREIERGRLLKIDPTKLEKARYGEGPKRPTVTAYLTSLECFNRFVTHAKSCGLSRGRAGEWLLDQELDERWFERAMLMV